AGGGPGRGGGRRLGGASRPSPAAARRPRAPPRRRRAGPLGSGRGGVVAWASSVSPTFTRGPRRRRGRRIRDVSVEPGDGLGLRHTAADPRPAAGPTHGRVTTAE